MPAQLAKGETGISSSCPEDQVASRVPVLVPAIRIDPDTEKIDHLPQLPEEMRVVPGLGKDPLAVMPPDEYMIPPAAYPDSRLSCHLQQKPPHSHPARNT